MAEILLPQTAFQTLGRPDSIFDQHETQRADVQAVAMLTSSLLGHLPGDEGEDLEEQSADEHGPEAKLQARKPHLAGRFSGISSCLCACFLTAPSRNSG